MRTSRARLLVFLGIGLVLLAACNFPRAQGTAVSGPDLVLTYAAETVQAQLTLAATGVQPTLTPGLPGTTATISPPAETATTAPGTTETPAPDNGTPEGDVCDRGDFVRDVTIPDNTTFEPGEEFTKTWRLRNTGTCTWNANYSIVFDSGEAMGGPASAPLTTGTVAPGEEVEVSVNLRAPEEEGNYQGFWMLRNQAGQIFGLGSDADEEFWVRIEVESGEDGDGVAEETYDFIAQASSAEWVGSGQGEMIDLTFGGADDDPNGVAKIIENVRLENGVTAGKTLLMRPRDMHNGGISGTFSEFDVEDGNIFRARVGFVDECGEGQVKFQLWYEEDGDLTMIEEWEKSCSGGLQFVEEDLSDLEGMRVKFILVVLADGSPQDDFAVWSSPRIELD
jgi:hypothetical protein